MEDNRKNFSVAEFVSNEETPVETRSGLKVTIYNTDRDGEFKVCGDIHTSRGDVIDDWMPNGRCHADKLISDLDLCFSPNKTVRRMTNQEFARWLRKNPEECREWKIEDSSMVHCDFCYQESNANTPCDASLLVRSNGGDWTAPLIEVDN